jgi:uncharacterized repeat protein (TIGR03803 family)
LRYLVAFLAVAIGAGTLAACSGGGNLTGLSQPVNSVKKTTTNYQVIYSFGSVPHDGTGPIAPLINRQGLLYGTTANGGSTRCLSGEGCGTVFSVTTSGTETILHRFGLGYGDNATHPYAGLIALHGTLYGTTATAECYGSSYLSCGTVYAISRYGGYSVLHSFAGRPSDGSASSASLVALNDVLYGTTNYGGSAPCNAYSAGCGTVFSITPGGTEAILHNFGGTASSGDGANPTYNLVALNGVFYGTTARGGANNEGTVFSISPSGTETVLHSFGGSGDGAIPFTELVAKNGVLYGTTSAGGTGVCSYGGVPGCGTVFSITPGGTETVLHEFAGPDGAFPAAGLVATSRVLYGATVSGGSGSCNYFGNAGCGTVYQVTTSGFETVLHFFGGSGDGSGPQAPLLRLHGVLYGTTEFGGAHNDGTVFSLTP